MPILLVKGKKIERPRDIYRIVVEFMEGDADGDQFETVEVTGSLTGKEYDELLTFIGHIKKAIKLDDEGRGGIEDEKKLIEHYRAGGIDIQKFTDIGSVYALESDTLWVPYPTYQDGWYTSFSDVKVSYFDDNGDEFEMIIHEKSEK